MAGKKRMRRFAIAPVAQPNSEINITPLVDVVLVLLIIFMVVTPLLEKDIDVRVPQSEQVEQLNEVPPDQLVVAVANDGTLTINSEVIAEADYVERLRRIIAAKAQGDRLVFFMAEEKANYAKVVHALDGARLAGAETLGMMTDTLDEKKPVP